MKRIAFSLLLTAVFCFFACKKKGEGQLTGNLGPGTPKQLVMDTLAEGLKWPWGLAFLPNGDLLFTERPGRINLLKKNESTHSLLSQRQVNTSSEGGLLSIAIDPQYNSNNFIYIYESIGSSHNRVVRFVFQNNQLSGEQIIVDQIPFNTNHDGGALKFGPDGYLYVGTGDAQQTMLSQDKSSLAGKILRVDRDGNAASGNPFGSRIWSYGHRNVQGFSWAGSGQMLATEHGPSGENGWCCHDEVNRIQAGNNFGWPLNYAGAESGTLTPSLMNSGNDTWAPSGCTWLGPNAVWPNCLVVACLKGERLIRFSMDASGTAITSKTDTLQGVYKRLRNCVEAPDGSLVFCSSNTSGSGAGVDRIYRLSYK